MKPLLSLTALALMLSPLTVLSSPLTALAAAPANAPAARPEITLFLKDGSDVSGRITDINRQQITLQTGRQTRRVPLVQYQGLVLKTPEELAIATLLTRNIDALLSATTYTRNVRKALDQAVRQKTRNSQCVPRQTMLIHVQIDRDGRLRQSHVINPSDCPDLQQAVANTVSRTRFPRLDPSYPHTRYVINYFYPALNAPLSRPAQTSSNARVKP